MLASMFGESIGFAISFTVLLIGAEILPQTLGNRFGIKICYYLRFFGYFYLVVTLIVAYPIGAILDKILGEEVGNVLSKS